MLRKNKVGVLFSGGKDSVAALEYCLERYDVKCLISIKAKNKESYMFHYPNINLVKEQANILGLDLIFLESKGEKERELKDLEEAISMAKKRYKIDAIASGAVASNYQKKRIERICKKLKLRCLSPNWGLDEEKYLRNLIKKGYKIIITGIAADGLDKNWLGRILSEKDVDKLKEISKKTGMNLAFEGGEAESFVLDCDLFKKKIVVEEAEKQMESDCCGFLDIKEIKLVRK